MAERVVAAAGVQPGDLVVDIGAGEGALTGPLLAVGARVVAVELHARRCETLRARFTGAASVTVVQVDAGRLRWPREPYRVVSNPPYAVWCALLRQLSRDSRLLSADLVLQRRVVTRVIERASRQRGEYVFERGFTVPRTAFRPAPRVDSAVLRIRRRA
jgi:23S rRNA (adenine-N6)-dimethyltransferase